MPRKSKERKKAEAKMLLKEDGAEKRFASKYGYFTADGREFVITRPDTPRPWVNVISNGDYGVIETQTGSGFSWRDNANLSRVTRWDQDLIRDNWGTLFTCVIGIMGTIGPGPGSRACRNTIFSKCATDKDIRS